MTAMRSVTEVARHFADYINRVAFHGERFVLLRGKRAVAELRPVARTLAASELSRVVAEWPHLDPRDAAAFEADIQRARSELAAVPPRDPWA
jgi:antitoxin (DNA-binding transcriptional repressor) of toxin-antitoxin stability system